MAHHYKTDGSLDMRYSSSKTAVAAESTGGAGSSSCSRSLFSESSYYASSSRETCSPSDLHYKKNGSLDKSSKSRKEAAGQTLAEKRYPKNVSWKKDESRDMSLKPSKLIVKDFETGVDSSLGTKESSIPAAVPLRKNGIPDMRYKESQRWVRQQANLYARNARNILPWWVPRKNKNIHARSAIGRMFVEAQQDYLRNAPILRRQKQIHHWDSQSSDDDYFELLRKEE